MIPIKEIIPVGIKQYKTVGIGNAHGSGYGIHLGTWNVRWRVGIERNGRFIAKKPVVEFPLRKPRQPGGAQ